jgi:deoxyadenosine/deoxycytidine kinase
MKDMKEYAFSSQVNFFKERLKVIIKAQNQGSFIMDRHLIDDFVFPLAHIEFGNFTENQIKE